MQRGGKLISGVAMLAVAACGTTPGKLQVRPTPSRIAAGDQPVPIRIAEARAQFALGNVALALEVFRKAAREDPSSVDALAGIAACYDRMGRFDLSRRHYEMALAYAPADTNLLAALANSLAHQGMNEEAAAVRVEIAARLAAKAPPPEQPAVSPALAQAKAPVAAPVTIARVETLAPVTAEARPVQPAKAMPAPLPTQAPVLLVAAPAPASLRARPLQLAAIRVSEPLQAQPAIAPPPAAPEPVVQVAELKPLPQPVVGPSVTIDLPPPRPATALVAQAVAAAAALPAETPEPAPPAEKAEPVRMTLRTEKSDGSGPRIERLSMGVVAIVTGDGPEWRQLPQWRPQLVAQSQRSATIRFVPIRQAQAQQRPAKVRLLNAARVHRLAARTRAYLAGHGWRSITIGDADKTRSRSLILYPAGEKRMARELSDQFGFPIARKEDVEQVTILLGRDAARMRTLKV